MENVTITVTVPAKHIEGAIAGADIRYWAREARRLPHGLHIVEGEGVRTWTVAQGHIRGAVTRMAMEFPGHFANLMSGNYDAETGDVLLQLACFGELKYG